MNFCGVLYTLSEYFRKICNTQLSLSNIMKHGESDVEGKISIQGIYLSDFWNYFWKREGTFKVHVQL